MTKKEIIEELFKRCKTRNDLVFDNDLVKKVLIDVGSSTNPYDMTKVDDMSKLPDSLLKQDTRSSIWAMADTNF